jgi:hypothetical protein
VTVIDLEGTVDGRIQRFPDFAFCRIVKRRIVRAALIPP